MAPKATLCKLIVRNTSKGIRAIGSSSLYPGRGGLVSFYNINQVKLLLDAQEQGIFSVETPLPGFVAEQLGVTPTKITTEPTAPTEPTEPTEPTAPTEPTEPTEPSTPTEPTEPSAPTEPTEPTEPSAPAEPIAPATPVEGSEPVADDNTESTEETVDGGVPVRAFTEGDEVTEAKIDAMELDDLLVLAKMNNGLGINKRTPIETARVRAKVFFGFIEDPEA